MVYGFIFGEKGEKMFKFFGNVINFDIIISGGKVGVWLKFIFILLLGFKIGS